MPSILSAFIDSIWLHWPARLRAANSVTVPLSHAKASKVLVEVEDSELSSFRVGSEPLLCMTCGIGTGPRSSAMLRSQQCTFRPWASQSVDTWYTEGTRSHSGLRGWQEEDGNLIMGLQEGGHLVVSFALLPTQQQKRVDVRKKESYPTSTPVPSHLCWLGDE